VLDEQGRALGMYVRIALARHSRGRGLRAVDLLLGLWITEDARVTVLNEVEFEKAVAEGIIAPVEAEHAEQQIRELTTAIAQKRYPPALVRNLTLVDSAGEATVQPVRPIRLNPNTKR
jgi:predicted RNA-binding protein associated with RNAse of E/G family